MSIKVAMIILNRTLLVHQIFDRYECDENGAQLVHQNNFSTMSFIIHDSFSIVNKKNLNVFVAQRPIYEQKMYLIHVFGELRVRIQKPALIPFEFFIEK